MLVVGIIRGGALSERLMGILLILTVQGRGKKPGGLLGVGGRREGGAKIKGQAQSRPGGVKGKSEK